MRFYRTCLFALSFLLIYGLINPAIGQQDLGFSKSDKNLFNSRSVSVSSLILPSIWSASWANDSSGTIRIVIYNFPDGYTNTDIMASSIRLNGQVPLINNQLLFSDNYPGIDSPVAIGAFHRYEAVQSLGECLANGVYNRLVIGNFSDLEDFYTDYSVTLVNGEDDNNPPEIQINNPTDGSIITTTLPLIQISYVDDCVGVDTDALNIELDGVNITDLFTADSNSAYYQVDEAHALSEEQHGLSVTIADIFGQMNTANSYFSVDATLPEVSVDYPIHGQAINNVTPLIKISYSDGQSGLDINTLLIMLNNTDYTSYFDIYPDSAFYQTTTGDNITDGTNDITVEISDYAGLVNSDTSVFEVLRFIAIASAYPDSGSAPLSVIFTEEGFDPTSTIEYYEWDFQGDGSWDTGEQVPETHTYTYNQSGIYNAILKVTNSYGDVAYDTAFITVSPTPPVASAEANPSNGEAPLTVNFAGSGTDPDGYIVLYEWDFDGDGTYDWSSGSTGNTSHEYTEPGTFSAIFRITDNDGLTDMAEPILTEVRVGEPGSPTAIASADDQQGPAPFLVNFIGTGIDSDGVIVLYEWDFDGDSTYDWSSATTGNTTYTYEIPGVYYPALRVTDNDGLTGTDFLDITAGLNVELSIPDNTFDPYVSETAIIRTTISAPIPLNIYIKTVDGAIVRNLVSNLSRPAGSYDDLWDGTDDYGNMVSDGPYYAVLEYQLEGEWITYDLTESTGGLQYLPTRQGLGGNPRIIRPLEDEFLDIHFSTIELYGSEMGASEITCFVGDLDTDVRYRTIIDRIPYPAGAHILWWDGLDDAGEKAESPTNRMILGMWGYTLPDNAIYLTGGRPVISDITADPNFLNMYDETCGEELSGIEISYNLSEESNVTLRIYDPRTNTLIHSHTYIGIPAGPNTLQWEGKANSGYGVKGTGYQIGLVATDDDNNQSMYRYTLIQVGY